MKPRTQITQERWEYDITTKSAKFIQQNISSLSEGNNSVYNLYLLQYMWLISSQKVNASAENVHFECKHELADMYAIHWWELSQWLSALLQPMLHISHPLFQFADITHPLLSTAALFSRFYSHRIYIWAIKATSYIARWILQSYMQYAIEIGSSCNCQVSQGSVETYLRWGGESSIWICTNFPLDYVSERIL